MSRYKSWRCAFLVYSSRLQWLIKRSLRKLHYLSAIRGALSDGAVSSLVEPNVPFCTNFHELESHGLTTMVANFLNTRPAACMPQRKGELCQSQRLAAAPILLKPQAQDGYHFKPLHPLQTRPSLHYPKKFEACAYHFRDL